MIDSPFECEHSNLDSIDARLFPSMVLAVAPAVTRDGASSLSSERFATPSLVVPGTWPLQDILWLTQGWCTNQYYCWH